MNQIINQPGFIAPQLRLTHSSTHEPWLRGGCQPDCQYFWGMWCEWVWFSFLFIIYYWLDCYLYWLLIGSLHPLVLSLLSFLIHSWLVSYFLGSEPLTLPLCLLQLTVARLVNLDPSHPGLSWCTNPWVTLSLRFEFMPILFIGFEHTNQIFDPEMPEILMTWMT